MNSNIKTVMTLAAGMLILGLIPLEQSINAQSPRGLFGKSGIATQPVQEQSENKGCRNNIKLHGFTNQVFDPDTGISSGPVTKAGLLNGELEDVVDGDAGFVLTPDPNVVAYISDLTITTVQGQLKVKPVTAFNIATGFWSEWGSIDPDTSTGRFAGATGVIFFSGKTIGSIDTGPYEAEITGEICLSRFW